MTSLLQNVIFVSADTLAGSEPNSNCPRDILSNNEVLYVNHNTNSQAYILGKHL